LASTNNIVALIENVIFIGNCHQGHSFDKKCLENNILDKIFLFVIKAEMRINH